MVTCILDFSLELETLNNISFPFSQLISSFCSQAWRRGGFWLCSVQFCYHCNSYKQVLFFK